MTREDHLEVCRPCRELDRLWNELFGDRAPEPEVTDREPEWKEAPAPGTATGPAGGQGKARSLPPANTCPQCGKWKQAKYETCFACSGMVLCEECGENYHSDEYEVCYQCAQDSWGGRGWEE